MPYRLPPPIPTVAQATGAEEGGKVSIPYPYFEGGAFVLLGTLIVLLVPKVVTSWLTKFEQDDTKDHQLIDKLLDHQLKQSELQREQMQLLADKMEGFTRSLSEVADAISSNTRIQTAHMDVLHQVAKQVDDLHKSLI